MEHLIFEIGLAVLLMALATYVASKFKLSAVPLLIIIGLVVGPHLPHFGLLDLRFIDSKPFTDGLLGGWDAFRNIARRTPLKEMTVRRRRFLVGRIAFALSERGKIVFKPSDVENSGCLESFARSERSASLDAAELLTSLYNDFGLLVERSPGLFSFSHLTFQEYFTAAYIVDNRRVDNRHPEDLLRMYRKDQSWFEVILLVAKMLPGADDFMVELTRNTALDEPYEVQLLMSAWQFHPLCEPEIAHKLMTGVVSRVVNDAKKLSASFQSNGETLLIYPDPKHFLESIPRRVPRKTDLEIRKANERRRQRLIKPVNTLRNLPYIYDMISAAGFNVAQVGGARVEPFETIRWMPRVRDIQVIGGGF